MRYTGNLHKLIDVANASRDSRSKWAHVLHYLEGHTVAHTNHENPPHDSPLPPFTAPSVELEAELFDLQGPKRDETPLRIACKAAPAQIIGALCHLAPEAARVEDSRCRIPLHWACRRPSDNAETNKVLKILILAYPEGLLQRDDGGRTPLHWLFWYHAPTRTPKVVEMFAHSLHPNDLADVKQPRLGIDDRWPLPEVPQTGGDVPENAYIIADARHGVLPLHYAVMQGASKDTIKALLHAYPASKMCKDRKGRTPLAWYLGAGHLIDSRKHVCGETNDPNAPPWWEMKLSTKVIQMLLSSRAARTQDDTGRMPLHWACHLIARSQYAKSHGCLALKAVQLILDNYADVLTCKDKEGRTPLQLFFDVVVALQKQDFERDFGNQTLRDNIDLKLGGPVAWDPPSQLIELLLKSPESDGHEVSYRTDHERPVSAAAIEDTVGALPIHAALRVATAPQIIRMLIQANPTSLVHTSEEVLQTPLVHALKSPYTAPLQSHETIDLLMQAYVTSRHGTFMDGRLALKMEDSAGKYPLHYASENQASLEIVKILCEKFPRAAMFQSSDGDLPLHGLLSKANLFEPPESGIATGASLAQSMAFLSDKEIAWKKELEKVQRSVIDVLVQPLIESEQHLKIGSSAHGMTPLHIVVAFDAVSYETVYRMLDTCPATAGMITTAEGYNFSCMDLHELRKKDSDDIDQWNAMRELLFAFCPTIDAWRSKDDLLEACVKLIRQEAETNSSFHLDRLGSIQDKKDGALSIAETLSSIAPPEIDTAYRPKQKLPGVISPSKSAALSPGAAEPSSRKKYQRKQRPRKRPEPKFEVHKSIYDDDNFVGSYEVSDNSDESDVDEEYYSSGESEYNSQDEEDTFFDRSIIHNGSSMETGSWAGSVQQNQSMGSRKKSQQSGSSMPKMIVESPAHFEEKKMEEDAAAMKPMDLRSALSDSNNLLSDVAMRLWTFFVLYNNKKKPEDNYLRQVEAVLNDMDFEIVEKLLGMAVPDYGAQYLDQGQSLEGITLQDVASPRPKALFHSFSHFLGKFEFPTERDGVLLHRSNDNSTVLVRAVEHVIATESFREGKKLAPGTAEEAIWSHGEAERDEDDYMESKFELGRRRVYFKFMKHPDAYENEVQCRKQLSMDSADGRTDGDGSNRNGNGNLLVPLRQKYSFFGDTNADKRYKHDASDERFNMLHFLGNESICLTDYPYALVFPHSEEGDLFDYFYHHGVEDMDEVADIAAQVARTLQLMHTKRVIHGNVSMRTIFMVPRVEDTQRSWAMSDFSNSSQLRGGQPAFSGSISHDGSAQFSTSTLPPEMFVKLTAGESRMYHAYWEAVKEQYDVEVDQTVVTPRVDIETGSTYVVRCHYVPKEEYSAAGKPQDKKKLPELPYKLLPTRESIDIWCFGQVLYALCTGGRPLFPLNTKSLQLLDYVDINGWTDEKATSLITEHVKDPLAQDLLLQLLSCYENRSTLKMEAILKHPFLRNAGRSGRDDDDDDDYYGAFSSTNPAQDAAAKRIIERRTQATMKQRRWRQTVITERAETDWLQQRTASINCWNFKTLCRINFSATEMVKAHLGRQTEALAMPCGIIILPYKLSAKNKKGMLAPTSKKDVERSERMGTLLLSLARVCSFAVHVTETIASGEGPWTARHLIESLKYTDLSFQDMYKDVEKIAAEHVEAYRSDPSMVARKLVSRKVREIVRFFRDAKSAYIYLVDEASGVPLADNQYEPYPLSVPEAGIENILLKMLPFMHICCMYARGSAGGISGLVKLIFEAAYPHVPPSWNSSANGLTHRLNDPQSLKEAAYLQDNIAFMTGSKTADPCGDLLFIRDVMLRRDMARKFCDMVRIQSANATFWTTKENAEEIQEATESYTFRDALEIQRTLEAKLDKNEMTIKKLEEEIERLKFHNKMNLTLPDNVDGADGNESDDISEANAVE